MLTYSHGAMLCLAALSALLLAEVKELPRVRWVAKPLASLGFLGAALSAGWPPSAFGVAVVIALTLSLVGDVLLIPARREIFMAGIGAFLAGHLGFGAAFLARGVSPLYAGIALAALLPVAWLVRRWLRPHVPAKMSVPVHAYIVVITLMVTLAAGTLGHRSDREGVALAAAAVAFFVSDLAVARHRFVRAHFTNRLWGLPLYYGAQLVFAWVVVRG